MKKKVLVIIALVTIGKLQAQEIIKLYPEKAPGSETWNWKEETLGPFIRDVTVPTITVFKPEKPNGIAVIVAPGGAFHLLSMQEEGYDVAKKLNEVGITAFVLKYRLVHEDPAKPYLMKMLKESGAAVMDSVTRPIMPLILQDGLASVKYVRGHALEYKIDPAKIGFMGFSAGGTVTMSVAYNGRGDTRPNFAAPIYGYHNLVIKNEIPETKLPLFICAASNDFAVPVSNSLQFYHEWTAAKQPAELHFYGEGGHGFGAKQQKLPVDGWMNLLIEWILHINK